jgi:hypothetical protein
LNEAFRNRAGSYQSVTLQGGRVVYIFTGHGGETKQASVPLNVWQRMKAAAEPNGSEDLNALNLR